MDIVKSHPYKLCEMAGVGFKTADKIAMSMGIDRLSPERVDEGILYTLTDAEGRGNLCMERDGFIAACQKTLETPELTDQMIAARANRLILDGRMRTYESCVYREKTAKTEEKQSDGLYLAGVPGFYRDDSGAWTFIHEKRGILIPVRDRYGRIQGLQLRRDNVEKRKFRWVSSTEK